MADGPPARAGRSAAEDVALGASGGADHTAFIGEAAQQVVGIRDLGVILDLELEVGDELDEGLIRAAGNRLLKVTLTLALGFGRFWNSGISDPTHPGRQQLLDDTVCLQDEDLGWNAVIKPQLDAARSLYLEPDSADSSGRVIDGLAGDVMAEALQRER